MRDFVSNPFADRTLETQSATGGDLRRGHVCVQRVSSGTGLYIKPDGACTRMPSNNVNQASTRIPITFDFSSSLSPEKTNQNEAYAC